MSKFSIWDLPGFIEKIVSDLQNIYHKWKLKRKEKKIFVVSLVPDGGLLVDWIHN